MNHKIVSFYHKNLNPEIKLIQKKIFDKLGIELTQVEFSGSHGSAINDFLNNNSWDIVTLFDVDSFPLKKEVISEVLSNIDDFTIYGNAQVSNSEPYAAPSFMNPQSIKTLTVLCTQMMEKIFMKQIVGKFL